MIIILKGFVKELVKKTKFIFSQFSLAFVNFEKLTRFHRLDFIVYRNGENLKILIDIFRQKHVVSNVIFGNFRPSGNQFFCQLTTMADIYRPQFSKFLYPHLHNPPTFRWTKCFISNMFSEAPRRQIKKVMIFALSFDIVWYGFALFLRADIISWIDLIVIQSHISWG